MRISKFMLPAMTVAGALALAGCGGGSDSMGDMDMGDKENGGDAELSLLSLPGGGSYGTTDHATGNIEAGEGINVGSGIRVNCPEAAGDAGCDYRVTEDGIYAAGNAEAVAPTVAVAAGADGDSSEDTHPLSHENLLAAIVTGEDRGELYGIAAPADLSPTSGVTFNRADGYSTRLYLSNIAADDDPDTNRVYFGHWAEWKRGDGSFGGKATREPVFGGNMPYGKLPLSTAGAQAYATGGVAELYYRSGDGDWSAGDGTVSLTAHFDNRLITGTVTTAGIIAIPVINLGSAPITASGFSGKAEFDTGKTRTGSWEGQFYGPSEAPTAIGDDAAPSTQPNPTHAAGKFSVARDADGTMKPKLTVQGAFGVGAGEG